MTRATCSGVLKSLSGRRVFDPIMRASWNVRVALTAPHEKNIPSQPSVACCWPVKTGGGAADCFDWSGRMMTAGRFFASRHRCHRPRWAAEMRARPSTVLAPVLSPPWLRQRPLSKGRRWQSVPRRVRAPQRGAPRGCSLGTPRDADVHDPALRMSCTHARCLTP